MISEFFENTEIFVTGGSGVVGKALIEKLLRSCNVRKIYILLRPKKNMSTLERLEKVKNAMVFNQLKLRKPDELDKKLTAIPGNATLPFLGITSEYRNLLEKVSIVFHCAATVSFDEPLRYAVKLNVGGTLEALRFAETLKYLKVFMHVSTFFSNPYLKRVEEKIYESPINWRVCLNLCERNDISEQQLDVLTRKLIVGFPNTYCFTKNLAESLVNDYRDKLPVGICRPSIVLFALEEPEPGFAPSLMGAMGLFALTSAGIMKTLYRAKDIRLDVTPHDIGIKAFCYYTLKTYQLYENKNRPDKMPIYTTSSCTHNDLKFSDYIEIMEKYDFLGEAALEKNFFIPGLHSTSNRFIYFVMVLVKQILPALLVDFAMVMSGRKPFLMAIHRKMYTALEVLKPFTFNSYESGGTTLAREMYEELKGTEFNVDCLPDANNYFLNLGYCHSMAFSIRKHLFKEDPKTLPRSRQILKIKIFIYNLIKILVALKLYEKLMEYLKSENLWEKLQSVALDCELDHYYFTENI